MSSITQYKDQHGLDLTGLTSSDKEAISFFFEQAGSEISHKMKSLIGDLNIAKAFQDMKDKYPQNSNGHRMLIVWMEDTFGWDKQYRYKIKDALAGAEHFVGSNPGMERCLPYFRSIDQLRALKNLPNEKKHDLYSSIMKHKQAPTAKEIRALDPYKAVPLPASVKRENAMQRKLNSQNDQEASSAEAIREVDVSITSISDRATAPIEKAHVEVVEQVSDPILDSCLAIASHLKAIGNLDVVYGNSEYSNVLLPVAGQIQQLAQILEPAMPRRTR